MNGIVEIRLHLKGFFKAAPRITYTDGWSIIKGCDLSVLTVDKLQEIHSQAGGGEERVRFFFGSKNSGIDAGVTEIRNNDDVSLWVYLYEGAPFLEVYSAKEGPPDAENENKLQGAEVGSDGCLDFQVTYDEVEESGTDEEDTSERNRAPDEDEMFEGEGRLEKEGDIWSGLDDIVNLNVCAEDIHLSQQISAVQERSLETEETEAEGKFSVDAFRGSENWTEEIQNEEELLIGDGNMYPDFNVDYEFQKKHFDLVVGQTFSNAGEFRKVLKEWVVRQGFNLKYQKNESSRITAVCAEGCSWRIHASPMQGEKSFRIKTIKGDHTCGRQYRIKQCDSRYLAERFLDTFKDDPKMGVVAFQRLVKKTLNVEVSKVQAYKAKRKALEICGGDEIMQFKRLYDYCETLRKYNPGSTLKIQLVDVPTQEMADGVPVNVAEGRTFQRLYFCFAGSKRGFLTGCRPIIGLDGCHLKGNYRGQLLSAIGRDGNDNMCPLAFCIAEAEKQDSWKWVLEHLVDDIGRLGVDDIGVFGGGHLTVISDRQKGLVNAVGEVFPNAEHRYCIRHMYGNFKKKYKGKLLMDLFWRAASATNSYDFRRAMEMMERADPHVEGEENAVGWLENVPREQWARAFFSVRSKCDILVNNLNESFNSSICPAREMSYVTMMDWIRRMLMRMISSKKKMVESYEGIICPNVHKKIEKLKELSRNCFPEHCDGRKFGVECGVRHFVVDLEAKSCTCRCFDITGIPCQHAIAAINFDRGNIEDFVDPCYKKDAYLMAYSFPVYPVPSMEYWKETDLGEINPPKVMKQPGRPKKLRRRDPEEPRPAGSKCRKGLTVRCKKCRQLGHNSRTCKNTPHLNPSTSQHVTATDTLVQRHASHESVSHQSLPNAPNSVTRRLKQPVRRSQPSSSQRIASQELSQVMQSTPTRSQGSNSAAATQPPFTT